MKYGIICVAKTRDQIEYISHEIFHVFYTLSASLILIKYLFQLIHARWKFVYML